VARKGLAVVSADDAPDDLDEELLGVACAEVKADGLGG